MDFRMHKNCICKKLFGNARYSGTGIRRLLRMVLSSEEIEHVIKKETGLKVPEEELDKLSKEMLKDEKIIDARRMNSFRGSGSQFRGGRKFGIQ
ncbi:conserved hypothetical protein [Methanococcus vannielii SB]|uniref:Uncharacterized protein n=1 Tax=Methanococcus vannielii (strain ATCC 35089 / DSM 1224 / JCM 13029 / OCM 148 / SB) TaxID=406327 RepID=A6US55_METVS|nr:hypothetical protein [Methanococcus vannielii]ABR55327.1 conserved hypothetical protein [Methanococcus vannielii SB]